MVPAILESADGCQASEKPLRLWGVPVKWASLVLLTFVTTWTIFSIKLARSSSQEYRMLVRLAVHGESLLLPFGPVRVQQGLLWPWSCFSFA